MTHPIKDSLLYKTLISQEMDFSGEEGAQRLQTLTMRIKKMEQSDRKELKADLDRIRTDAELDHPRPLQERGICVLLLTDFGTHSKSNNIVDRFFRYLRNELGNRISSKSLIDTILEIKTKDQTRLRPLLDPEVVRENLMKLHADKQSEQSAALHETNIRVLNALHSSCVASFDSLFEKVKGIGDKILTLADVFNLAHDAEMLAEKLQQDGLPDDFKSHLESIQRTAAYKDKTALQILDEINHYDSAYLTHETQRVRQDLAEFGSRNLKNARAIFSDVIKLAHCVYVTKLEALIKSLANACIEENANRKDIAGEIGLLKRRSDLLTAQRKVLAFNESLRGIQRDLDKNRRKTEKINSFIFSINGWTKELGKLMNPADRPKMLRAMLTEFLAEPKDSSPFIAHVKYLFSILCHDIALPKPSPQLDRYLESFNNEPQPLKADKERWRQSYAIDPMTLADEASKCAYVENYLECLKFAYSHDLRSCQEKNKQLMIEIEQTQIFRRRAQKLELLEGDLKPEPVVPPAVPSFANYQEAGLKAQLLDWARKLESNDLQLETICTSLLSRSNIQKMVYQNFYFIMKKNGKIKADHVNWGARVFFGYDLNTLLVDGITQAELRNARALALRLAAEDKLITSETDANLDQ